MGTQVLARFRTYAQDGTCDIPLRISSSERHAVLFRPNTILRFTDAPSYRRWVSRRNCGVIGRVQRFDLCRQGATESWARPRPIGRVLRRSEDEHFPVRAGSTVRGTSHE